MHFGLGSEVIARELNKLKWTFAHERIDRIKSALRKNPESKNLEINKI